MKKLFYLIVLTLILGLVLTGCSLLSNISQVPTTGQSGIAYLTKGWQGDPDVFTLYAGQDIEVGTVTVSNDGTDLTVIYETNSGWKMTETHLAVAKAIDDSKPPPVDVIPQTKKGNPKPGQFPYKNENLGGVTSDLYVIPLESIEAVVGDDLYIAAHTSLLKLVDTVYVNAIELSPTCSNVILESGMKYLLKASGIANAGADIDFDAKYSISGRYPLDTWTDLVTGYEPPAINLLDLKVDGEFVDWGAFNEDHVYYWEMDGIDSCVPLLIFDTHYPSNTGSLMVEIYQEESAWAVNGIGDDCIGSEPFLGANWATYFTYTVQIDGLVLWLDAGEGITHGSGVSMWEDQSGNDNHAEQSTVSFQPTYIPNELNSKPVVRFAGGEKYLRHSPIITSDYTAFYVLKLYESAGNLVYYYHAGSLGNGDLGFFAETKNKLEGWGSAGNVDTSVTVRTSDLYPTPLDWRIHTHQPEALYKDGFEVDYARENDVYAGGLTDVGSRSDHETLYFVGDIAEIIVYDRILTVPEREMVETYLSLKYGL